MLFKINQKNPKSSLKVIITGASGMVGEGVLHECLLNTKIESVLSIGRKSCNRTHPKLKEILLNDLYDISSISDELSNYDACFFCAGISSVGLSNEEYYKITYELTLNFAEVLSKVNPEMNFCYISGMGTDSSEKGKLNWARVKGKTENDLMKLKFNSVYNFRPAFLKPEKGMKNIKSYYKIAFAFYPFLKLIMPNTVSTLKELALAMINVSLKSYDKNIIEVKDIIHLSKI